MFSVLNMVDSGRVVREPVDVNPGLNVNWSIKFSCLKMFFTFNVLCSLRLHYHNSKLKGKQSKYNISPKRYKTEIKILANPGLA